MYYLLVLSTYAIFISYSTASDASLCSSYHNQTIRRFEISCSSAMLNNAACYVDTESNSCKGAYPFFFVDTLAYLDGPHTVFIIANGFNYSFQFCGVKPLVVQCQETTDYSKLELKLACRVNKQRFQAQCAVDGSPWSTCSARIALNEYSAESHTMMITVIDDDGLTYNRTIQFRGATQPDAHVLPIVTIAGAAGAGVAFIIGMVLFSTCVCYSLKKQKENKIKAASDTSVAYRNTTKMETESDQKFAETAIYDNICYEYVNREVVILCENESYGRVFIEEGKEK